MVQFNRNRVQLPRRKTTQVDQTIMKLKQQINSRSDSMTYLGNKMVKVT